MAGQPFGTSSTGDGLDAGVPVSRSGLGFASRTRGAIAPPALVSVLTSVLVVLSLPAASLAGNSSEVAPRMAVAGLLESADGSLLVAYYEGFLRDHDIEGFRQRVSARYDEGTLGRLLESGEPTSRRAAVLALGLTGTFASNAIVARGLRDRDPVVRDLAADALWAIWFRADTPENNATLAQVQILIRRERLEGAVLLATHLIGRAPNFAEAYNQRALAHFLLGHYAASAEDCQRVLERNPYHIGALSGLAQCQLRLDQRREALKTFRRALRLQPFSTGLRQFVTALEAEDE